MNSIKKEHLEKEFSAIASNGKDNENLARIVVQSVSRGNINLQLGRYITEKDKEAIRKKMKTYSIKIQENEPA